MGWGVRGAAGCAVGIPWGGDAGGVGCQGRGWLRGWHPMSSSEQAHRHPRPVDIANQSWIRARVGRWRARNLRLAPPQGPDGRDWLDRIGPDWPSRSQVTTTGLPIDPTCDPSASPVPMCEVRSRPADGSRGACRPSSSAMGSPRAEPCSGAQSGRPVLGPSSTECQRWSPPASPCTSRRSSTSPCRRRIGAGRSRECDDTGGGSCLPPAGRACRELTCRWRRSTARRGL